MKPKNTIKLLLANFRIVFSDMIFRVIVTAFFFAIAVTFMSPLLHDIFGAPEASRYFSAISDIIAGFFKGGDIVASNGEAYRAARSAFFSMLGQNMSQVLGAGIGLTITIAIYLAIMGIADYACGVVVNEYMSSLNRKSYFKAVLGNLGRGFIYQLIATLINVVWTALLCLLCGFLFEKTVKAFGVFALTLDVIVLITGNALLNTFISSFMPAMITGQNKVGKALGESFIIGLEHFSEMFVFLSLTGLIVVYLNVSMCIFTLGAGLVFSIPATFVLYACVKLVNYYSYTRRKYYIDIDNIVVPVELRGEDEKYLKNIDV